MNLISLARSLARRVAAAAVLLGTTSASQASDAPAVVLSAAPAPLVISSVPCQSCQAPAGAPCGPMSNGKMCPSGITGRLRPAYQTKLCPGACFGYFQTQWSKWEDVCPLPYQGQGISDAPPQRTTPVTPVRAPSGDPKKTGDPKKDAADPKKDATDPKKDAKGGELPLPRPGAGIPPMPVGRTNPMPLPPIPQAPSNLPIPTGRIGS